MESSNKGVNITRDVYHHSFESRKVYSKCTRDDNVNSGIMPLRRVPPRETLKSCRLGGGLAPRVAAFRPNLASKGLSFRGL